MGSKVKPSKRVGTSNSLGGVFDRGLLSIYSPPSRRFANKAAVVAGVATLGIVGYAFWRGEKGRR